MNMAQQTSNRFIYPFYQKILLPSILTAENLLQAGRGKDAWNAMVIVAIHIREKTERLEMEKFIASVDREVQRTESHTYLTDAENFSHAMTLDEYYRNQAKELYKRIFQVLEDKNYLKAIDDLTTGHEIPY